MTAQTLEQELTTASASLKRCRCGSKVVMHYRPGCTFIHCIGEKTPVLAKPDWQPTELAKEWNA